MQGTTEVEVKIRIPNGTDVSQRLQELGFQVAKERVFEANVLYDTAGAELRAASKLLRLRQAGDHSVITFKGPEQPGAHKSREELETSCRIVLHDGKNIVKARFRRKLSL